MWVFGSGGAILNSIIMRIVLGSLSNTFWSDVMSIMRRGWIMTKPIVVKFGSNMSTKCISTRYSYKFDKTSEEISNTTECIKGDTILVVSNTKLAGTQ